MPEDAATPSGVPVHVELAGSVGHLEIRRPEKRNAISSAMAQGLLDGLRGLEADDRCRAVVMSGQGSAFSSGADMSEVRDPASIGRWADDPSAGLLRAVAASRIPVVAAVEGWAVGIALGLLGAAAYVVADDEARFLLPEIRDGYLPHGVIPYLTGRMPPETVVEWALTGETRSTADAVAAGLVTHPVAPGTARSAALELATRLAAAPRPQIDQAMGFLRETRSARGATRVRVWADRQMDLVLHPDS